jgi:flagellar biosynthesis protein FliR
MDLGVILSNYTYIFILVIIRYAGLFLITPVLGSKIVPSRIKIGVSFFLALITLPLIMELNKEKYFPSSIIIILGDIVKELSIGLIIGFLVYLIFAAIQLSGQFIDLRMGFAIVNVMDPIHGVTAPMMGQLENILATLIFLIINGHHFLIRAIYRSFEIIPLGKVDINSNAWQILFRSTGDMFIIAFRIALPIIATLFITDIIFGFLARTIPQINIFIVGLPTKILIGFIIFLLSVNSLIYFYFDLFQEVFNKVIKIISLLS